MLSVYPNFIDHTKDTIVEKIFKYNGIKDLTATFNLPLYSGEGNYIFPVRISTLISAKTIYYNSEGKQYKNSVVDDDYIIKIPNDVVLDVCAGKCVIVFDGSDETYDITHSNVAMRAHHFVKNVLNHYNFSKNHLLICNGNLTPFKDIDYANVAVLYIWANLQPRWDYTSTYLDSIKTKKIRSSKILMLMNKPYMHRLKVGEIAFKKNWREGNAISLNLENKVSDYVTYILNFFDPTFIDSLPWKLDITFRHKLKNGVLCNTHDELKFYDDTYVNFVIESMAENTSPYNMNFEKDVSEKTFKPIIQLQPFVIYGQPHILKLLKSYGYKTFSKWWDESYDDIEDTNLRLEKISEIFDKINSMTHSELADMMYDMLPILEHNRNHHCHLLDTGFYTKDFYDTLNHLFVINNDSTI